MKLLHCLCLTFVMLTSGAADNRTVLRGVVTRVVDGDTIDVRLASGPIRVRLNAIDAPERSQPGGADAARDLLDRVPPVPVVQMRCAFRCARNIPAMHPERM